MKIRYLTGAVLGLAVALSPVRAAEDARVLRLALCQDSWQDWQKTAPDKLKALADYFNTAFKRHGNDAYAVPVKDTSIAGLRIVQAFPGSVGMGVGFSVIVDAGFDKARTVLEGKLGKKLTKCEASDGMHSCELPIAAQRTVTLMAQDNMKNRTLLGCYYYYEK